MPEPKNPIRLVALDIDGTLMGPDHVIRPRTTAAVRAAVEQGVVVALVTGRMAGFAFGVATELGITAPLVAHHGAVIWSLDAGDRRLLRHAPLASETARDALEWGLRHGLPVHLNRLDELIMASDDPRAGDFGRLLGVRPRLVADLRDALDPPVTKVMAAGAPGTGSAAAAAGSYGAPSGPGPGSPAGLLAEAQTAFRGRATVTISNPRFLEFLAPEASKGRAVEWLARRYDVPLGQAMAIGDNLSDADMLAVVGHPVAMPHAPDAVRAVARRIAPPVDEDGVAQILESLVLGAAIGSGGWPTA